MSNPAGVPMDPSELAQLQQLVQRLESVTKSVETAKHLNLFAAEDKHFTSTNELAKHWEEMINTSEGAKQARQAAPRCGAVVEQMTGIFLTGLLAIGEIFAAASSFKKPATTKEMEAVCVSVIKAQQSLQVIDQNGGADFEYKKHYKLLNEAFGMINITTVPNPATYAGGVCEAAVYHSVGFQQDHRTWANALRTLMNEIQQWCGACIKMGVAWKTDGSDPKEFKPDAKAMQEEVVAAAPSSRPKPAAAVEKPAAPKKVAPSLGPLPGLQPIKVKEGIKWKLEQHSGTKSAPVLLKMDETAPKENIDVYRCANVNVLLTGKCKAIQVDSCDAVNIQIGETDAEGNVTFAPDACGVISAIEIVNCNNVKVFGYGPIPSIAIDKTQACVIYLTASSIGCRILSSKSSEMNVNHQDEHGDWKESPIPEQFVTTFANGKWTTSVSDIYG